MCGWWWYQSLEKPIILPTLISHNASAITDEQTWQPDNHPCQGEQGTSTQRAGCDVDVHRLPQRFLPCSVARQRRVHGEWKCHNTHTWGLSDIQARTGLPLALQNFLCMPKDNWPNGLPLPHRLHMEWRGWKSPSSEYWSDILIDTWIWIYQGSDMAEGLEHLVWGFACAASAQNLATTEGRARRTALNERSDPYERAFLTIADGRSHPL